MKRFKTIPHPDLGVGAKRPPVKPMVCLRQNGGGPGATCAFAQVWEEMCENSQTTFFNYANDNNNITSCERVHIFQGGAK